MYHSLSKLTIIILLILLLKCDGLKDARPILPGIKHYKVCVNGKVFYKTKHGISPSLNKFGRQEICVI
jgi:hypothetical protein